MIFRFPIAYEEPRIITISKDLLVVSWNSEEVSLIEIMTGIYRNTESVMIIYQCVKKTFYSMKYIIKVIYYSNNLEILDELYLTLKQIRITLLN